MRICAPAAETRHSLPCKDVVQGRSTGRVLRAGAQLFGKDGKMQLPNFQPENSCTGVYRIAEIAQILDMPLRTAYAFCARTDAFVVKRLGPQTLRVKKESFDRWLKTSQANEISGGVKAMASVQRKNNNLYVVYRKNLKEGGQSKPIYEKQHTKDEAKAKLSANHINELLRRNKYADPSDPNDYQNICSLQDLTFGHFLDLWVSIYAPLEWSHSYPFANDADMYIIYLLPICQWYLILSFATCTYAK